MRGRNENAGIFASKNGISMPVQNQNFNQNSFSELNKKVKKKKKSKDFQKEKNLNFSLSQKAGITMIALIITIIVMIVLASVSINAIVGDNGIITQAQNATVQNSIAVLEEYLQEEYIKYYDEANDYSSKLELLIAKFNSNGTNLTLKDGTKNYITYSGKMYYLLNKASLEEEISDQLVGGDTTEYSEYIRLIDVYGITSDLKVYYCSDGIDTILGTADVSDVDPTTPLTKVNADSEMKAAISAALGITDGRDLTIGDVAGLKSLELDGSLYNITSLSALSELSYLKTLTLKNLSISDLSGLEGCSLLYYIYFKDCIVTDYSNLGSVLDLQYLYIYLSSDIDETTANTQIANLGSGLSKATKLDSLEYFGISGVETYFENSSYVFTAPTSSSPSYKYSYTSTTRSNVSDISPLSNFASNIKSTIKYVYLLCNSFDSIESLSGFSNIYELDLNCNSNLTSLSGLKNHDSIVYLTAHSCGLTDISDLSGCSGLQHLTLQSNSNLTSLSGLKDSTNLLYLIAYSCNITDITALADCSKLYYLHLESNSNLVSVSTLSNLTSLKYLYLNENTSMDGTELYNALEGETTILANVTSYSMPSDYLYYFDTATSYDYSNANLTDTSKAFLALKGKTNVTRLNLSGNSSLSDEALQEVLSSMTGLQYLSLQNLTNLESTSFVTSVTGLVELDLRGCSSCDDLTDLNENSSALRTLIIDNTNISLVDIEETIVNVNNNNFNSNGDFISDHLYNSWIGENWYNARGFCGMNGNFNYSSLSKLTFWVSSLNSLSYTIDLTGCLGLIRCYVQGCTYIFPSSVEYISCNSALFSGWDLSLCSNLKYLKLSYEKSEVNNFSAVLR